MRAKIRALLNAGLTMACSAGLAAGLVLAVFVWPAVIVL